MALLMSFSCKTNCSNFINKPLIWNMDNLDSIKKDSDNKLLNKIIVKSDAYCLLSPVVVTDKKKTFAPDLHYYCSIGPYWWPDPENPDGKYINKDEQVNPESKDFDLQRIGELSERCKYLSVAFYLTQDYKYYEAYINQIKAWFIDEETYMYPNLAYAQVKPGYNNNLGRTTGTIDTYVFNDVIESIRLVSFCHTIDDKTIISIKRWFDLYITWLEDNNYINKLNTAQNNISLAFDVTLCNIYLFLGKEDKAKIIFENFYNRRLLTQINENGEQPAELIRSKAFSYSLYNLKHIIDFCYLAKYWKADYYDCYGLLVDKAFGFLLSYIDSPEKFPYQQLSSWDACRYNLKVELIRRKRLTVNSIGENKMNLNRDCLYDNLDVLLRL